jgi:hypothetical protein
MLRQGWLAAVSCTRGGFCAALGVTARSGGRDAGASILRIGWGGWCSCGWRASSSA